MLSFLNNHGNDGIHSESRGRVQGLYSEIVNPFPSISIIYAINFENCMPSRWRENFNFL